MTDHDADLKSLFAQPAHLPDVTPLLREILLQIERQQRRRNVLLWAAALMGALPVLLLAAAAWPILAPRWGSLATSVAALFDRDIPLPQWSLGGPYSVWILSLLGLVATGMAAVRSRQP